MPDAPVSILPTPSTGGAPASPVVILDTPSAGGAPASPVTILATPSAGGSPASPVTILDTPSAGGAPASPVTILATASAGGAPASPVVILGTPSAGGSPASPAVILATPSEGGPWQIITDGIDALTNGTPIMREAATVAGKMCWSNDGLTVVGVDTTYPRISAHWDPADDGEWVCTYAPDISGSNDLQWTSAEDVDRPDEVQTWTPPPGQTALPIMRRVPIVPAPWAAIAGPNGWPNRLALGDVDLTLDGADLTLGPE